MSRGLLLPSARRQVAAALMGLAAGDAAAADFPVSATPIGAPELEKLLADRTFDAA